MITRLEISGFDQILRGLGALKPAQIRRVMRLAMNPASTPMLQAARRRVPVEDGVLKRSLSRRISTEPSKGTVTARIGPRIDAEQVVPSRRGGKPRLKNPDKYLHLVLFGTKPHMIGNIRHPGAKPQPFLQQVYSENREQAENEFIDRMWAGIQKLATS